MLEEEVKAKLALYTAIILGFSAFTGALTGVEPLHNQFFAMAAWACALLLDNLLYRLRGASPLVSATREFVLLALLSVVFCSVLELLNLRLQAWYYVYAPSTLSTRWAGRFFSWAALLPALFSAAELLRVFGIFGGLKAEPLKTAPAADRYFYAAGGGMLLLALAFPRPFWPLAWAALLPLAEPPCLRLGLPSLLRDWGAGLPGRTLRLALAGLFCGLAWNFLNRASGCRWEFQPVSGPALFGVSVFLYPAYAFLAMQAYSLCALASWPRGGRTWEDPSWAIPGRLPAPRAGYAAALALFIISYIAFRAVDAATVKLYLGWI
jgi:hypothetical protein